MAFEDLPDDWDTLPLDDLAIMDDVVDLFAADQDRLRRSLVLLLCDDCGRLVQPLCINDLPLRPSRADMAAMVAFLEHLEVGGARMSLLAALAYPTDRDLSPGDRTAWHTEISEACTRAGIRLLGLRVATRSGVGGLEVAA